MRRLLRHKWEPQDGFRIDRCMYCGLIRYWDSGYQKIMYRLGQKQYHTVIPQCKRLMHSDRVLTIKPKKLCY